MFRASIRKKIVSIAVGLIALMVITSALSMIMAGNVSRLLEELTTKYVPAYGDLARANVRSLERALALRRMVIAKMQVPPDEQGYAARLAIFEEKDREVGRETEAARKLINSIIDDVSTQSDNAALARIDSRIDAALSDTRRQLDEEDAQLLEQLSATDFAEARRTLARVDALRDEFSRKIDAIRADMLTQVFASTATVVRNQHRAMLVSATVTALAATVGLLFALLVSGAITRAVRLLLEGTRQIEAGRLDQPVSVTTKDEIGQLSAAFNRMVEQLRSNERTRETFGRYIDPRVVKGLIDQPTLAVEGQRRIMTVMFCDMKGFTSLSEHTTPQGLVKVMNRYLSTMSEPMRNHGGIIDKYIGDAIMTYWGPPFVDQDDQGRLACLAALDMTGRVTALRKELPELLGVRSILAECDIRIGIATGEVLVGSIGSEFMMNYTVMGDAVNMASRLEGANKVYGTRILATETTIAGTGAAIEVREIDRLVVVGQTHPQVVFEPMAQSGALPPNHATLRTRYAEGLAAYRDRRWDDARSAFNAALEAVPGDGPSTALIRRIDTFAANPLPADWDGSWHLDRK
jgi:adenylate cyclase